MEYSLVFTMYSTIFLIMLFVTFFSKKKNKTVRVKMYTAVLCFTFLFTLFELLTIYVKKFLIPSDFVAILNWKLRLVSIIGFFFTYFAYCNILFDGTKKESIKDLLKEKKYKITAAVLMVVFIFVIFILKQRPIVIEGFEFVAGSIGFVLCGISCLLCGYTLVRSWKLRKEKKNIFKTFLIITIQLIVILVIQMIQPTISYTPLTVTILTFLIYFNIENPDIELSEDLESIQGNLDKLGNSKIDFLFNLSYDLIDPVKKITSLSKELKYKKEFDNTEYLTKLRNINSEGTILLESINNMLDVSIDNKSNNKDIKLADFLDKISTNIVNKIGVKPVKFEIEVGKEVVSRFYGDEAKIEKVLITILTNSVKYTDVGKIRLVISAITEKDIQRLTFKISDTGIGMSEEQQQNVFVEGDNGLGLSLVKTYIEEMNGEITFDSLYLGGTTFYVKVPLKMSGNKLYSEENELEDVNVVNETPDCSKYKALIVDDDMLDLKVAKRLLEKYNFQIYTLNSPKECIKKIKAEEEFDIIFIDHKMQEMDGVEVMKVLRLLETYKIPRLVMLTANAMPGMKEHYIKEGFDEYLSKPIDVKELDKVIKRFYRSKNQ